MVKEPNSVVAAATALLILLLSHSAISQSDIPMDFQNEGTMQKVVMMVIATPGVGTPTPNASGQDAAGVARIARA